jgi:hypothetical protein
MKFVLSAFCLVMPLAFQSAAATCTAGSLASYIGLGSVGCTIGSNTLTNFAIDSGLNNGRAISPSAVNITPLGGSLDPGINTTVSQSAQANIFEAIFTYQISGSQYQRETYTLSGASEAGGGAVTGLQNNCAGGVFDASGVLGCTGTSNTLLTLDGVQNQDSVTFALPTFLTITDDLTIDGSFGTASAGTLVDRFSAAGPATVPEPGSSSLIAVALFTAAGLFSPRRRKSTTEQ